MLSLPSKPWKKVKVTRIGENRYTLAFLSPLNSEAQFQKIIHEDLEPALGPGDRLSSPLWEKKEMILDTPDLLAFQKKLIFQNIMLYEQDT